MSVRRHYIETTDVSGSSETQVALAEALIDQYVGPQDKFYRGTVHGQVTALSGSNKVLADTSDSSQLFLNDGYFANCHIEIIGGTGAGQQAAYISASSRDNRTITLHTAFTTTPDTTSVFRIYQLAKFPRRQDNYSGPTGQRHYKNIPQADKDACVAQVQFIIAKGDEFFTGDGTEFESESFLNYSYSRGQASGSQSAVVKLVAPQARVLLRGIYNRKGTMQPGVSDVRY